MVRVVNGSCNTFHCQSGAGEHDLSNDMMEPKISTSWKLVGGFKDFLFSPLLGEMIQFDLYFFQLSRNHQLVNIWKPPNVVFLGEIKMNKNWPLEFAMNCS